jgi:hypothetical protein
LGTRLESTRTEVTAERPKNKNQPQINADSFLRRIHPATFIN